MAVESYEAAERAVHSAMANYRSTLRLIELEVIDPIQIPVWFHGPAMSLMAAFDDAFTSAPDPQDDPMSLIELAMAELERLTKEVEGVNDLPQDAADSVRRVARWIQLHIGESDTIMRLVATVDAWDEREPVLAPLRVRQAALATVEQAYAVPLMGRFPDRLIRSGMRAFGPTWAADLAQRYLDGHFTEGRYWGLVLVALDELAAWAGSTDLHGLPEEFRDRSISALISIAGHPDLTAHAIRRIPLHRVTSADRHELAELLADRSAVMPVDWISEADQFGTLSVEVAYLRALDAEPLSWPGAPSTA